MTKLRIILLTVCLFTIFSPMTNVYGQSLFDLLQLHPKSWEPPQKSLDYFYDTQDLKLNTAHDTLDIIILGHKKVSYRWHDVLRQKEFNGWNGFEKDIEHLLEKLETLNLDFENQNYHIVFSPESDELIAIVNPVARFAKIGENFLPTKRHQVTLTYYSYLLEVDFFLGEMDELEVLKSAGINDLVKSAAKENNWYDQYKKRNLNKVLLIDSEGNLSIDTYFSRENPYYPKTNLELGGGYLFGNSLSLFFQPRYNIRLRTKKTNIRNNTLFFALTGNLSHVPQTESKFEIAQDYFLGIGFASDQLGNEVSATFGYRAFGQNGILLDNPLMLKTDFAITPKLKISHSLFSNLFSPEATQAHLVGISYLLY